MARQVFDFDPPDRFVAGTTGSPGSRTFFLQARSASRTTSVRLEKQQVSVLAERVDELLDEVLRRSGGTAAVPAIVPAGVEDTAPLDAPIEEEFQVGTMSLAWDTDAERVVIECFEVGEDPTEDPTEDPAEDPTEQPPDADDEGSGYVLRICLTGAMARSFAKRALAVVAAGRPPCPFCGLPLDPEGHVCPRANGYRR
jgi:uncharacterized repeat protein (TIGR03847 family)